MKWMAESSLLLWVKSGHLCGFWTPYLKLSVSEAVLEKDNLPLRDINFNTQSSTYRKQQAFNYQYLFVKKNCCNFFFIHHGNICFFIHMWHNFFWCYWYPSRYSYLQLGEYPVETPQSSFLFYGKNWHLNPHLYFLLFPKTVVLS